MVIDAELRLQQLLATDPAAAAEWAATQKLTADPRVTGIGTVLRRTSLDELPQLLNVLRGQMSLVGPRPIVAAEVSRYGDNIASYYAVRPGVTGLWQVSGRSETSYARRVQLDTTYVRNWSFWQDLAILLRTIPAVLARRGAV
jgi:undecaprenyl-phosphate galactose phosphotransferase